MKQEREQINDSYFRYIVKWGRITGLLGIILSFGPILVLTVIYGLMPPTSAIITAFIAMASAVAVNWFVEPISYFPVIGLAGTYMAFVSGNISNLRIPAAAVAQSVAGVEPGTEEGNIISTLGIATSVFVNIVVLAIGVFAGASILTKLPESVLNAFNYLLPALFGAIFVQFAMKKVKIAPIALILALSLTFMLNAGVFSFLPGMPSYVVTLGSVFGTIAVAVTLYKKELL